ncbi:hypothetical protein PENTCL1PPCAC_25372, partial [Pristionchus entomophagus]
LLSFIFRMQVTKVLSHALTTISFPLQLVSCGPISSTISYSYNLLFIVSFIAHILYYLKVIRRGETQYKSHFLYYEMGVAFVQSFPVVSHDNYIGETEFWMIYVPLIVQ